MSMCFVFQHLHPVAASRKLGLMVRNVSEVKSVKAQGPGKGFPKVSDRFETDEMYSDVFILFGLSLPCFPAELNRR